VIPDLVVLGNLLVDDLVFPDGRTRMGQPGGAVLYASLGAALFGLPTGLSSWRGTDYPREALDALEARGVDLAGLGEMSRPGLRTWLLYEGRRRQVIHHLDGPTHAQVSPEPDQVPVPWLDTRAFHLAPMPFDVQSRLLAALGQRPAARLSLDPYAIVKEENLAAWRELLVGVDVLFLSEDDLELSGAAHDPRAALRRLAGSQPDVSRLRLALLKRGAQGGVLYDVREDRFIEWEPRAERVVDPTGAGDAFAGGFLAGWLRAATVERALAQGVVGASFAIEDWGATGILSTTAEAAAARLRAWFGA
jgi:sugar/nucleoside kinase (ribokinase family)